VKGQGAEEKVIFKVDQEWLCNNDAEGFGNLLNNTGYCGGMKKAKIITGLKSEEVAKKLASYKEGRPKLKMDIPGWLMNTDEITELKLYEFNQGNAEYNRNEDYDELASNSYNDMCVTKRVFIWWVLILGMLELLGIFNFKKFIDRV